MIHYKSLERSPRLLLSCVLTPLQGDRIQPTGFPDLGAARYCRPKDGKEMLLVESAQSVANRLEATIWDSARGNLLPGLDDLPYLSIDCGPLGKTTSIQEFHRLNSPYIWNSTVTETVAWRKQFAAECGIPYEPSETKTDVPGALDLRKFYRAVFKWDPNSALHGVFLEKLAGRLRMARLLSGFVEAEGVRPVESGGVKIDHLLPSPKALGLSANEGFGNVPFPRTEFVADRTVAYFNLDLALLRGYGLGEVANKLLIALALFKIRSFLDHGLRLRAACDLRAGDLATDQPRGFDVPSREEIIVGLPDLIKNCKEKKLLAEPAVTELKWSPARQGKITVDLPADTSAPAIDRDQRKLVKFVGGTAKRRPRLELANAGQECVEAARALFSGNEAIVRYIDEAVRKQGDERAKAAAAGSGATGQSEEAGA